MPRFVVLHHETPADSARNSHFDLMLEQSAALRTWALEKMLAVGESVLAEQLADHRLAYLEYEGDITGNRGRVRRLAAGQYDTIHADDDSWIVQLQGDQLSGKLTLSCNDQTTHLWRVSLAPD
jgi:hypothetical protein